MSGAAEWELEYPIIAGDSSRGGMFEPREMASELQLQLFAKNGIAHYEPYWVEMNGHAFNLYLQKGDAKPAVRFDLKEMRMYPAAKGLPGKEVDPKAPMFGVVSRYHRMVLENGVQDVPPTSVFFFECSSLDERDRWLTAYFINMEWAQRFSGLFYPRGSARVEYSEGVWRLKVHSDNTVRYLKSSRLHVSAKIDGTVFKKGSKFASAWKQRYAALKGQCTLEYYSEKGGESLGKLNMADGKVVLVCNDTLTPPTMASTKEKLSNLKGKIGQAARRASMAPAVEEPTREEKLENLLWFAILSPGRTWLFRAANLEDLERWMFSMEDRCTDFKQAMGAIKNAVSQSEKSFQKNPGKIRYRNHPLNDGAYPVLDRAAIPGRPMSGQFTSEDAIRAGRSMSVQDTRASVRKAKKAVARPKDPELNLYDETLDDFELDYDSLQSSKPVASPRNQSQPNMSRARGNSRARDAERSPRGLSPRNNTATSSSKLPQTSRKPNLPTKKAMPKAKPAPRVQHDDFESDEFSHDDVVMDTMDDFDDLGGLEDDVFDDEDAVFEKKTRSTSRPTQKKPTPKPPTRQIRSRGDDNAAAEELQEKTQALENLQKQFNALREETRLKKVEERKKDKRIEQLEADLEESRANEGGGFDEEEVESLKSQLTAEQKKVTKLESQVKRLTSENERLTADAGAAREVEEANEELNELRDQVEELESTNERLERDMADMKKQLKEANKASSELDRERKKRELVERKLETAEEEAEKAEDENEDLKNQILSLEEEVMSAKQSAGDQGTIKALKKEREGLAQQVVNLEKEVSTLQTDLLNARDSAAGYSQRKAFSNVSDPNVREVVRTLNEENDQLMSQLVALKAAAQRPEDSPDLEYLRSELDNALHALDTAAEKLQELERENDELQRRGGGGGGGGSNAKGNPAVEQRLRAEIKSLSSEKADLEAKVKEMEAEIVLHLQDKEELAKAFEQMQNDQFGDDEEPYEDSFEEEPEPEPEPVVRKKALPKPAPKKKPAKKSAVEEEDPFADAGIPDEDDSW